MYSTLIVLTLPIANNPQLNWPPRSPHEARMSTPGGRDRFRRLANRTSPSPSPSKRLRPLPSSARATTPDANDDDDDDDEETLQLKLQAIEAKLKLKKLQKTRTRDTSESEQCNSRTSSVLSGTDLYTNNPTTHTERRLLARKASSPIKPISSYEVHVPVSPVRKIEPPEQKSPGRILLGIDKGLKGSDISLRRAPSLRNPSNESRNTDSDIFRRNTHSASHALQASMATSRTESFSERMARVRSEEQEKKARAQKIKTVRSTTFGIDDAQMSTYKETAQVMPNFNQPEPEFTRDQVLNSYDRPTRGTIQDNRSRTSEVETIHERRSSPSRPPSSSSQSTGATTRTLLAAGTPRSRPTNTSTSSATHDTKKKDDGPGFDSFSSFHLSKRIIPQTVLAREFSGKKVMLIPDLLATCKAPDWSLPDVEEDIVLLGIIAGKSDPRAHKATSNSKSDSRSKYMVMTLVDLKWELSLYLFATGFDKFWKLDPGTVVAILNPNTMPPQKADTGKFSITINSSDTTVLEIGTSRDLGFCKAVKKDGKTCDSWVDSRHTEFCEFHTNSALQKTLAGRMEVNTMSSFPAKKGAKKKADWNWGGGRKKYINSYEVSDDFLKRRAEEAQGIRYIAEVGKIHMLKGDSTADRIDNPYYDADAFHFGSKDERLRKRRADQEREREITKKLSSGLGIGLGADYARARNDGLGALDPGYVPPEREAVPDAKELGLLGGKAEEIKLGPLASLAKRKRASTTSTACGSTSSKTGTGGLARGWGGALTKDLERMGKGESITSHGSSDSRVAKKTRLLLPEKGIRVPGRESLGTWLESGKTADTVTDQPRGIAISKVADDDDSDLDIVFE